MRRDLAVVLLALSLFALGTPAWAHPGVSELGALDRPATALPSSPSEAAPSPSWAAGPAASREQPDAHWIVLLAVGVGAVAGRRSRRAVAGLVVILLSLFLFEGAVHSVHHLGDRSGTGRCVMESAASHLSGAVPDLDSIGPPVATRDPEFLGEVFPPRAEPFGPDRDRAPPRIA